MQHSAQHETETFVRCIQDLQSLSLLPLGPFPGGTRLIIVDEREFGSGLPLPLIAAGFTVVPAVLTVGDYVLTDDIVIERKAYSDLVGSLRSGRLQLQRMRQFYKQSMLLIEFSETDQFNAISAKDRPAMVMAKLVTILKHFPLLKIIWARNNTEAAKTLMALAEGQAEPNSAKAIAMGMTEKGDVANEETRAVRFLTSIPFLSAATIDSILTHCRSLRDLAAMSSEQITKIIGPVVGIKLYALLHGPAKPPTSIST
jgi:DNA excision repair protein ERCC-4